MGVQGLWVLLEPVGRRVNIEALTNKRLAIDASIWLHQFLKAMRDDKGEVMKNAHLLGFFRRICRLLFHRVRPIFVFDGATPPLKRRTTIARRRQRERQDANLRKTAEKLLLAQLKQHALTTLAKQPTEAEMSSHISNNPEAVEAAVQRLAQQGSPAGTAGDELLAAQLNAEESQEPELARHSLPISSHADRPHKPPLKRRAASREATEGSRRAAGSNADSAIAIEEDGDGVDAGESGSVVRHVRPADAAAVYVEDEEWETAQQGKPAQQGCEDESSSEDDDNEADEQLAMLPEGTDSLDPAVLSTLPPSLQLELMGKLREAKTYRNREEFANRTGNPLGFSTFQMQQYLDTSSVRKRMDSIKDQMNATAMAGRGGVQAHRIAAQADREYILTRDEPADGAAEGNAGQGSGSMAKAQSGDAFEVSLSLPAGTTVEALFKPPPDPATAAADEEGEEDDQEWEDATPSKGPATLQTRGGSGSGSLGKVPENWRERMRQRQKYWSLSHGFQFGRKLADWGKGDKAADEAADTKGTGAGGPTSLGDLEEDRQLQEAIRLSLQDDADAGKDSDSDIAWEEDEPAAAKPPTPEAKAVNPSPGPKRMTVKLPPAPSKAPLHPHSPATSLLNDQAAMPVAAAPVPTAGKIAAQIVSLTIDLTATEANRQQSRVNDISEVSPFSKAGSQQQPLLPEAQSQIEQLQDVAGAGAMQPPTLAPSVEEVRELSAAVHTSPAAAAPPGSSHNARPAPAHGSAADAPEHTDTAVTHAPPARLPDGSLAGQSGAERDGRGGALCQSDDGPPLQQRDKGMEGSATPPADDQCISEDEAVMILEGREEAKPTGVAQRLVGTVGAAANTFSSAPIKNSSSAPAVPSTYQGPSEAPQAGNAAEMQLAPEATAAAPPLSASGRAASGQAPTSSRHATDASVQPESSASGRGRDEAEPGGRSRSSKSFNVEEELEQLERETKSLQAQQRKQTGAIDTPTGEMFGECQELLQMFGLPYIIAPMEAEAQCAWLNHNGLVDGVVTDDNDVFLFGARHVYRHIFEERKYVEEYRFQDVEEELGLDRDALIRMALLLGSDYTEGVPGIGIVNALEIVRAFPTDDALKSLRDWVNTPDAEELAAAQGKTLEAGGGEAELEREFKRKHRGARKGWSLPEGFPNSVVIDAYTQPRVDSNKERFTHARPDLELLRGFCREKFGWAADKVDQLLLPVLKAYEERQTQLTMDAFLSFSQRFAKVKSSRLQKALAGGPKGKRGIEAISLAADDASPQPKAKKPRKPRGKKATGADEQGQEHEAVKGSQEDVLLQGTGVFRDDTAPQADPATAGEAEHGAAALAATALTDDGPRGTASTKRKSRAATGLGRGSRGGGQGRGRGRARGAGRGRGRGRSDQAPEPEAESSESSQSDPGGSQRPAERTVATRGMQKPGGYNEGSDVDSGNDSDLK